MHRAFALAAGLLVVAAAVFAADIGGKWKGEFQGGDGTRAVTFDFKLDNENVTGTVEGLRPKPLPVREGRFQGGTVTFWVLSEWQNEPVKLVFKGKLAGGEIRFTMGTEDGGWSTEITAKPVER